MKRYILSRIFFNSIAGIALMVLLTCCSDDKFTVSPTATLSFSTDSIKMDTVFTTVGSRTYDFWVYNRSDRSVRLESVHLMQGNQTGFRVNVDGAYLDNSLGSMVNGLEVRSNDSIRVFVELTAPRNMQQQPQTVEDKLMFTLESGIQQHVVLTAQAWDAIMADNIIVSRDTTINSSMPIVISKGLVVDSSATLTIENTTLYFHDKAGIDVYGTLKARNTVMRGDRLDRMFDYLPYDRISGQWRGVRIHSSSFENELIDSEIRNAEYGVICDSTAFRQTTQRLYMEKTIVHNCSGPGLEAFNSWVGLLRCQFSNTLGDCVSFHGGAAVMDHCTMAQFYPFSADRGAALRFTNFHNGYPYPLHHMSMKGSLVTGYADDVVMGESLEGDSTTAFSYYFENSLLRTEKVMRDGVADTINFVGVHWETPTDSIQGKQHFKLIDENNLIYDFHLDTLSTAHGMGCYD